MNRRNFLKGFTAATGALAIAPGMVAESIKPLSNGELLAAGTKLSSEFCETLLEKCYYDFNAIDALNMYQRTGIFVYKSGHGLVDPLQCIIKK